MQMFENGMSRALVVLGALVGAASVALAAAASHDGDQRLLGAAAQMGLAHAPVFLALGLFGLRTPLLKLSAIVMVAGLLVFAGDLLYRHQTGMAAFPMAAPIGGGGMIAGWVLLALAAVAVRR